MTNLCRDRIQLDAGWSFKQKRDASETEEEADWLPVKSVPSDVYTDLLANNKTPDPFLDLNELAVRWVAAADWIYKTTFQTPPGGDLRVDLVFEGLDTFAKVTLNGTHVLSSDNMFVSHRLEITPLLLRHGASSSLSENELQIVFASAKRKGEELVREKGGEHRFISRQTEEGRIPVRKAQYHWGWDWGPILTGTSGPWRPVFLETYVGRVGELWVESDVAPDLRSCKGRACAKVEGGNAQTDSVLLCLSYQGERVVEATVSFDDEGVVTHDFDIPEPRLWWPRGCGRQDRYELTATLLRGDRVLDRASKPIGFRSVELVQEPDEYGKSFYFRVNGVDVFAGGSCWIPASSYLSQVTREQYRDWIELVAEGNHNMIRVWGGGIYEDDAFYDACDELGIMVFQDFCFACGSYPTYPESLRSVELEARQNVRRLRSHPSLVIWAGSNEDYQVQERYKLDYDYEDKDPESWLKSSFPARYLYEYLLPKIVSEEHHGVAYHPTSPWGDGKITSDPTVGDIHQWDIWHGGMEKYQHAERLRGRFVSEFGMEAYPHMETIKSMIITPDQLHPGSMSMDFHNKAIGHERRLVSYMTENFRLKHDLGSFVHLSQMVQAETMSYAYKAWRRDWNKEGARRCGGVLVWQLNDCWPTISWAIVDHYLVKKPAYYSIKRALAPLAVGVSRTLHDWTKKVMNPMLELGHVDPTLDARRETKFDVWVANGQPRPLEATVTVRFVSICSGKDVMPPQVLQSVKLEPNATTEIISQQTLKPLDPEATRPDAPFDTTKQDPYIIHAVASVDGEVVSQDTAWPQPFKYIDFSSDRGITIKAATPSDGSGSGGSDKGDTKTTTLIISAKRPVKGLVFEETRGTKLSDNNLDIVPGETCVVEVAGPPALEDLRFTFVGAPAAALSIRDY